MEKFKSLPKNEIAKLPKTPGVYAFMKSRKFLYIGKAANLKNRVKQHKDVLGQAEHIAYIRSDSEYDALILENELIKKYQPKYNTQWKDDKNYFYVAVTREEFPRIFITHQPKLKIENCKLKINYIGPFVNGKALKQKLKDLRKVYPYRTCKTIPRKPCLWYHLNQCPAPCLFYGQRLEAYDISNIQGTEATGSMVTFINGKPDKNFYRRFKIKTVAGPNDVAMIKEVLTRRLKHKEWPYPDTILIDGGKAQLNVAIRALCESAQNCAPSQSARIRIMALAKKENKLFIKGWGKPVLLKSMPEEFANLILRARDEAHRFARAYHHKLREKRLLG